LNVVSQSSAFVTDIVIAPPDRKNFSCLGSVIESLCVGFRFFGAVAELFTKNSFDESECIPLIFVSHTGV